MKILLRAFPGALMVRFDRVERPDWTGNPLFDEET